jgi:hypothetical protein
MHSLAAAVEVFQNQDKKHERFAIKNNCSDFIQFSLYPVIESGYHANPFSYSGFGLKSA